jgi:large subunit ribosomal protein L13Ae
MFIFFHATTFIGRLKLFDGCPSTYEATKKKVVPAALKVSKLKTGRKFTVLGNLATSVGWSKKALIEKLEEKRLQRGKVYYQNKVPHLSPLTYTSYLYLIKQYTTT